MEIKRATLKDPDKNDKEKNLIDADVL